MFVVQTVPNYAQVSRLIWLRHCSALRHKLIFAAFVVSLLYSAISDNRSWCCLQPWQMRPQRSCTGSAFIIDVQKRHIMTNAHVVCPCAVALFVKGYIRYWPFLLASWRRLRYFLTMCIIL